ncbi:Dihydrodipicolinate synthetase family protein [Taphrina deformans PYCC 5710]|uniref:Dihydrodipicolinate synthetase family protein n=1 Tax=Taphrina deformans (strain PYCC 5710 / ATCC 11124 / CBS 356.35 / IMI 108563 / JCM 9778 / NBRC 8474) TaxID=1097556 RepID=R4X9C2_TAPDE|nr:Dihydrodipicolinate synthetase family protein [Taphrina deformans PYCC 5710]|eukprot:CCG82020.1 Dihydrodipicolinate synthetase family protein [Taphrina deformans PYCC 5710]
MAPSVNSTSASSQSKSYPPGIHVPSLTFFDASQRQEIDWRTQQQHLEFLVQSGVHGIVLAGTNGEAMTLTRTEKSQLVALTKKLSQDAQSNLTITMGTSGTSTRDVLDDCDAAYTAGADFVLVLVPAFFHFAMTTEAICVFFEEVADYSRVPILIYNFPGVAAGLNVDSNMIDRLAKHSNIVGVKLTCGSIAKVTRAAATHSPKDFAALAGQSDWLVPALAVGGTGCVTGVGNLYPLLCLAVYNEYTKGNYDEAQRLQGKLALAELGFGDGGINGTKWVVGQLLGYPDELRHCRNPYPQYLDKQKQEWLLKQVKIAEFEKSRLQKLSS